MVGLRLVEQIVDQRQSTQKQCTAFMFDGKIPIRHWRPPLHPTFPLSSNCSYRDDTGSREFIDCLGPGPLSRKKHFFEQHVATDPSAALPATKRRLEGLPFAVRPRDPLKVQFKTQQPVRLHSEALARLKFISQRELHDARLCQQARVGAEAVRLLRQ
jgi:hypothetical protein